MWRRGADTGRWQSMVGQNMLECQLRKLGVYGADKTSSSHPNVDESFKFCEMGGWNALARYYLTNFRDGAKQSHLRSLQSFPLDFSFALTGFLFVTMSLRQVLLRDRFSATGLVCTGYGTNCVAQVPGKFQFSNALSYLILLLVIQLR
ncbi:hypothetical protein PanWU01x14_226450 [Parasponia andersonii]|uniref:Uncharacterized protein n=1 Tax=Parasponia andersonii TaxID=3476 RepID=A0A2P5BMJ2_PARAD|nr:hypothetical protein PanWU01x14_226450 [Parasponia andersonii]